MSDSHTKDPEPSQPAPEGPLAAAPSADQILECIADPVAVFDRRFRFLYLNGRAAQTMGRRPEDVIGKTMSDIFPAERTAGLRAICERAWEENREVTIERRSSLGYWVENHVYPLGETVCIQWRNIGERKRAENALRESEERYRGLFESMREAFTMGQMITDEAGNPVDWLYLDVNAAFETMFGYKRHEVVGKKYRELFPGTWSDFWVKQLGRVAFSGEPLRFENYGNAGGYYEAMAYCPRRGQFALILMDITERKRAEEALREKERRFRELANAMPQLVWIADASGSVTFLSQQWQVQTGVPEEAGLGWGWIQVWHPEDRPQIESTWRECVSRGEAFRVEGRIHMADGEHRWHLIRGVPIRDERQEIVRWYGTCTDIHDIKRAEERLRHAQKLQSVGLLAGGIAHDFNNLLTGVLGNASMLFHEVTPEQAVRVRDVMVSAERAAHLIRQLLAYAGKGQAVVRDIDIARAVNEIVELAQASLPRSIDLTVAAEMRLPMLRMDPGQLQQILMNLVINAGEAIGEGNRGRIGISASQGQIEESFTDTTGEDVAPGRYIILEVSDTGVGIEEAMKAKIFDPFFTTKFTGRGLGLAAVAGIIRAQKGGVMVESAPGQGTRFRVLLPAGERSPATSNVGAGAAAEAILVVDDEAAVRDLLAAVLRKQGYRVLTAVDGRDALNIWEHEKSGIRAVVLDIAMPVMNGPEFLDEIKKNRPEVKVLLTSGFNEDEARRLCAVFPDAAFLPKPYTAQQVVDSVEQLFTG